MRTLTIFISLLPFKESTISVSICMFMSRGKGGKSTTARAVTKKYVNSLRQYSRYSKATRYVMKVLPKLHAQHPGLRGGTCVEYAVVKLVTRQSIISAVCTKSIE